MGHSQAAGDHIQLLEGSPCLEPAFLTGRGSPFSHSPGWGVLTQHLPSWSPNSGPLELGTCAILRGGVGSILLELSVKKQSMLLASGDLGVPGSLGVPVLTVTSSSGGP